MDQPLLADPAPEGDEVEAGPRFELSTRYSRELKQPVLLYDGDGNIAAIIDADTGKVTAVSTTAPASASHSLNGAAAPAVAPSPPSAPAKAPAREGGGSVWRILLASGGVVLGGVGQAIFLPLFLSAVGNAAGSYFVYSFLCILFAVIFTLIVIFEYLTGRLSPSDLQVSDAGFALIGACDALNGLLTVYCSALDRTPGALQAILPQLAIPITVALSFLLYRITLSKWELLGATAVVTGVLVTMIPTFASMEDGASASSSPLYPLLFALGVIPGVLTSVLQTGVYRRHPGFNKSLLLLYRSWTQAILAVLCFWTDLIPGLGTSSSFAEFGEHLGGGLTCFFRPSPSDPRCYDASWLGLCFTVGYCMTYWSGAVVIEAASANYVALLTTINTPLAAAIWFAAPALTAWAGGPPYSATDLAFGLSALFLLVVPGSLLYKFAEGWRRKEEVQSTEVVVRGPRELVPSLQEEGQAQLERIRALRMALDREISLAATARDDARLFVYVR
jgi:drug/metabolite transporter (DMT)-like permease